MTWIKERVEVVLVNKENQLMQSTDRDDYIDFVGGMILYMIFGHIVSWTNLNETTI